jgi:hypothetical protein
MMTPTQLAATREAQSGWWPSKYGADDQAGALNEITPGKVLEAIRLVRQGRIYDLAHVLHQGCDTWSYGPYPPEDPDEFLLVISHAKLRGATGAWVAPLAIA